MCAVYVFRNLYPKFWTRHTPYLYYTAVHVADFNFLLQFEIAMIDFPLQFFTCASIHTSEFSRHTTISLIKLLRDIFYIVQFTSCFWQSFPCHQLSIFRMVCRVCRACQGLPGFPGFAEVSWVCRCSLSFVRFDEVYWWQ